MDNNEKTEVSKIRCLMLNEKKDIVKYGANDFGSKTQILTYYLNDDGLRKCQDFRYEKEFIMHLYVTDTFDDEMVVGVNRFDKCYVKEFDENKKLVRISASNKEFFNMSQLKLLRKDKIGNILSEMGDNDSPVI